MLVKKWWQILGDCYPWHSRAPYKGPPGCFM